MRPPFLVVSKNAGIWRWHYVVIPGYSEYSAPYSRMLGIHSMYSGIGVAAQSNGCSGLFHLFLFRNRVNRTHAKFLKAKRLVSVVLLISRPAVWSVFTWRHGNHIYVLQQRNGGHIDVLKSVARGGPGVPLIPPLLFPFIINTTF